MILGLKSAGPVTWIGLYESAAAPSPVAEQEWESGRALADELLGQLEAFLKEQHTGFAALSGLIIFSGPGSFTSLRIGHTIFNALADSLNLPIAGAVGDDWPVSALADLAGATPGRPVLPHYGAEANITKPAAPVKPPKT